MKLVALTANPFILRIFSGDTDRSPVGSGEENPAHLNMEIGACRHSGRREEGEGPQATSLHG